MAVSFKNFFAWLKLHYDKIIALFVLILLVGSLLYLAVRIGTMHREKERFEREIRSLNPKHAHAGKVDTKDFVESLVGIEKPLQLTSETWSIRMVFVIEKRVWCVDCTLPIRFDSSKCPFCNADQPPDREQRDDYDYDRDGIWDKWEKQYGLNPTDPSDAEKDADNDGFSNIEEFMAKTDPNDANSHPPITIKLRLLRIDRDPFMLRFKSVVTLPDGKLSFGLNLRGGVRTYFAKLEEEVEGFKLLKYEPKKEEQEVKGIGMRQVDVSILTLQRGDKLIPLVKDKDVQWNEFTARLVFTVDNSSFVVKADQILELKTKKFKVINIDIDKQTVLLEAVNDGQKTVIEKFPESRKESSVEPKIDSNAKPAESRGENPK